MVIEFYGTISEQCQKDVSKRSRRLTAIEYTIVTVLFGIVPTVVCGVLKDEEYFFKFFGLTILCAIMTVVFWLIAFIRKPPKGVSMDILVRIEDSYITRSDYAGIQKKPLNKVKKVIDSGDWYYVVFKWGNISNAFVCQKDLLREGTIEQFESLFEGKIKRGKI